MATSIRRITRRDWLVGFGGFTLGVCTVSAAAVARRHVHRIMGIAETLKDAVYASDEPGSRSPSLNGRQLFPPNDPWNTDISKEPVDPNSDVLVASIGPDKSLHPDFGTTYNGAPFGMPYVVVPGNQPKVAITFSNADESDAGPYPIPPDAPIEGGPNGEGDRHVLVMDRDNWMLYELFRAFPRDGGKGWTADSGAIFDLKKKSAQRPVGWTSTDAAGLPVLAGLARYDEIVEQGKLTHALRFSAPHTRRGFVYPASHFASGNRDSNVPPMGMRVRLKADYDISRFPPTARVILQGLQTYGMILADNGGPWFISGAPDSRWSDAQIETLKHVRGSDFEVVRMGKVEDH
jgi:hypothetical protein